MSIASDLDEFFESGEEKIVDNPLGFKAKLGIGEYAYGLIRARENMTTFTEALGVGTGASAIAGSSVVAGTFFAKTGLVASALSAVGMGAAAVTPIGWVVGAGIVSGAAYMGVSRIFEKSKDDGVVVIPKYINTPLDVIAVALIELMLPVSLKLARVDGNIGEAERKTILSFFVDDWGYSVNFVTKLIGEYEDQIDKVSYSRLAKSLHSYCNESKDCSPSIITKDFIGHLRDIIEADGIITEAEQRELKYLTDVFATKAPSDSVPEKLLKKGGEIASRLGSSANRAKSKVNIVTESLKPGSKVASGKLANAKKSTVENFSIGAKTASVSAKSLVGKASKLFGSTQSKKDEN